MTTIWARDHYQAVRTDYNDEGIPMHTELRVDNTPEGMAEVDDFIKGADDYSVEFIAV
ncbi:hypothetical protein N9Z65_00815 [bacterium]|nr:hypothetical protein [bacterium]